MSQLTESRQFLAAIRRCEHRLCLAMVDEPCRVVCSIYVWFDVKTNEWYGSFIDRDPFVSPLVVAEAQPCVSWGVLLPQLSLN